MGKGLAVSDQLITAMHIFVYSANNRRQKGESKDKMHLERPVEMVNSS